jgi:hypothetical protein
MHLKHKANITGKRAAYRPRILSLHIHALRERCLVSFMEMGVILKKQLNEKYGGNVRG